MALIDIPYEARVRGVPRRRRRSDDWIVRRTVAADVAEVSKRQVERIPFAEDVRFAGIPPVGGFGMVVLDGRLMVPCLLGNRDRLLTREEWQQAVPRLLAGEACFQRYQGHDRAFELTRHHAVRNATVPDDFVQVEADDDGGRARAVRAAAAMAEIDGRIYAGRFDLLQVAALPAGPTRAKNVRIRDHVLVERDLPPSRIAEIFGRPEPSAEAERAGFRHTVDLERIAFCHDAGTGLGLVVPDGGPGLAAIGRGEVAFLDGDLAEAAWDLRTAVRDVDAAVHGVPAHAVEALARYREAVAAVDPFVCAPSRYRKMQAWAEREGVSSAPKP